MPNSLFAFLRQKEKKKKGETFTPIETTSSLYSGCLAFVRLTGPSQSFHILYYFLMPSFHELTISSILPTLFIIMRGQTFYMNKYISQHSLLNCEFHEKPRKGGKKIQSKLKIWLANLKIFNVVISKGNCPIKAFMVGRERWCDMTTGYTLEGAAWARVIFISKFVHQSCANDGRMDMTKVKGTAILWCWVQILAW